MSRILNRQRQLAEQGRLRLGYTVPGDKGPRPVRSETWIVTSHSRNHVEHAATLWGGDVHEWEPMGNGAKQWRVITTTNAIPAILPPGDPLTSAYEMWSKGGCQRRCDGVTEQFSGSPCICLAQHGDGWYELGPRQVCVSKSRLKVLLPDMPGLGSWRMETGSFYATDEIAGMVDTIRGAVGESVLVPVTLRIEPRTRVASGQTKQFVVPVVELRGVTAGALLSGQAIETRQLTSGNPESTTPLAIQAADPFAAFRERLEQAETTEDLTALWTDMVAAHLVGKSAPVTQEASDFTAAFKERAAALQAGPGGHSDAGGVRNEGEGADRAAPSPTPDSDGVVDAELVDDADTVWQQILDTGGQQGMSLGDIEDGYSAWSNGLLSSDATAAELHGYLEHLKSGERVSA